jgi:hypothetical protein
MSLLLFLKKLWKQIRSLFQSIPAELKAAIHIGVTVTENIKTFTDSPAADVLTALIPGNVDDVVIARLRTALPQLLTELKLTDQCASDTTINALTQCGIKELQSLSTETKKPFLHSLSILLAQVAADGKLTWEDGVYLLEWYYQQQFKSANI